MSTNIWKVVTVNSKTELLLAMHNAANSEEDGYSVATEIRLGKTKYKFPREKLCCKYMRAERHARISKVMTKVRKTAAKWFTE